MKSADKSNRRLIAVMLLALVLIFVGLLYVTAMQADSPRQSNRFGGPPSKRFLASYSHSYWGQSYQHVMEVYDVATGELVDNWADPGWSQVARASSSGDQCLYVQWQDQKFRKFKTGNTFRSAKPINLPTLSAEGLSQVHWIDNDTKLIYPDPDGSLNVRDLESGETTPLQWKRPVGGFTYWDSERNLIWCDTNTGGFTSYQMVGDELLKVGICKNLPYRSFFADGTRVLIASVDLASCDVVDVASGEVLRTLHSPRRSAATWRTAHDHAVCFYGDGQLGASGQFNIAGAAVFDPHSGKLLHDVDFDAVVTGITFDLERLRFIATRADLQLEAYDLAGSRTVIVPSPFRWWWPARTLFIALASAWWLAWLWLLRSKRRSMKAFVDIAILHAIVFSCMCLRTQAYVHGPSWNGAVISWETVGFFASTISMVLWFLVWTVFGPQRWALRVAAFVLAASFVSMGMMNMWSAASNDAGDIVVGLLSSVGALFAMLWLAHAIGIRLRHVSDPDEALPGPVKRQVFVRDLFLWMLAFGLFFAVIKVKEFPLPDPSFAWILVAENTVIAASAMLTMWLALGSIRWRIPIVSIGFASAWYFLQWIEPIELLHIGSYAIAMIFVSALALRYNGYQLRRQPKRLTTA